MNRQTDDGIKVLSFKIPCGVTGKLKMGYSGKTKKHNSISFPDYGVCPAVIHAEQLWKNFPLKQISRKSSKS